MLNVVMLSCVMPAQGGLASLKDGETSAPSRLCNGSDFGSTARDQIDPFVLMPHSRSLRPPSRNMCSVRQCLLWLWGKV